MDNTLSDFLKKSDTISNKLYTKGICLQSDEISDYIKTLYKDIKMIQSISRRLADVANMCKEFIPNKDINTITKVDPLPTAEDHSISRCYMKTEKKSLVDDLTINVNVVNSIDLIPVSNLYYVNDINQFAVNINGIVIKGNLAIIKNKKSKKSKQCSHGIKCDQIKNNKCLYYHPPDDYKKLSLKIPEDNRVFSPSSWVYNGNKNKKYIRKLGGKNTIVEDLKYIKKTNDFNELFNREGQLIHDILLYNILHQEKMLVKYSYW